MIRITGEIQRTGGGQPLKRWFPEQTCGGYASSAVSSCSVTISIADVPGVQTYTFIVYGDNYQGTITSNLMIPPGSSDVPGYVCSGGIDCGVGKTTQQ